MRPRMPACDRVPDRQPDRSLPRPPQEIRELPHLAPGLRRGPCARRSRAPSIYASPAVSRSIATSSADVMRTGRSSTAPSAWVEAPKPPKTTFTIDRFIARHMNTDSRKPDDPSRAPARIRIGLRIATPERRPGQAGE